MCCARTPCTGSVHLVVYWCTSDWVSVSCSGSVHLIKVHWSTSFWLSVSHSGSVHLVICWCTLFWASALRSGSVYLVVHLVMFWCTWLNVGAPYSGSVNFEMDQCTSLWTLSFSGLPCCALVHVTSMGAPHHLLVHLAVLYSIFCFGSPHCIMLCVACCVLRHHVGFWET